jgi:Raf kinase inhibitor-like YbhB/YbcL family protein
MRRTFATKICGRCAAVAAGVLIMAAGAAFGQRRITLESPVLKPDKPIPKRYTSAGNSSSPPLVWRDVPEGTMEMALVFEDLEGPTVRWLVYRIPPKATGLPEGIPSQEMLSEPSRLSGTIQGLTDFKHTGPGYIAPDQSAKGHRCRFTLYALDARMGLLPGLDRTSLMSLIQSHIIGKGELLVICGQ